MNLCLDDFFALVFYSKWTYMIVVNKGAFDPCFFVYFNIYLGDYVVVNFIRYMALLW